MLGPNHRLHRWNCWRPTQPTRGAPRRVSGSLRSWRVPHGSAPLCLVDPSCRGSATLGGDGADGPTRRRRGADRARCPRPRIPKRAAPGGSSQTLGGDRIPTALGGGCPWAVSRRTAVPRGGPSGAGPNRRALRDARPDRRLAGGAEAARTRARGAVTATVDPAGPSRESAPPGAGPVDPGTAAVRRGEGLGSCPRSLSGASSDGQRPRRDASTTGRRGALSLDPGAAGCSAVVNAVRLDPASVMASLTELSSHARSWHATTQDSGIRTRYPARAPNTTARQQ